MTDLHKAAEMALQALEFSLPAIEDFGSKEQLTDCHRAIMALYKSLAQPDETETLKRCLFQMQEAAKALAQPEQEPFKPDWVSYRQGVADGAAQHEQEEPLPLVDIGVDVTPEGTHVVACYNKPDAVQEMFYSQFHPLAKLDQSKYSDIVSDGGLDPRNKFDAQHEQEPVAWCSLNGRGEIGYFDGKPMIMVGGIGNEHHETPLYTAPAKREWVSLSDIEINKIVDLNTSDDGGFDIWCDGIAVAHIVCAKLKEKNA